MHYWKIIQGFTEFSNFQRISIFFYFKKWYWFAVFSLSFMKTETFYFIQTSNQVRLGLLWYCTQNKMADEEEADVDQVQKKFDFVVSFNHKWCKNELTMFFIYYKRVRSSQVAQIPPVEKEKDFFTKNVSQDGVSLWTPYCSPSSKHLWWIQLKFNSICIFCFSSINENFEK